MVSENAEHYEHSDALHHAGNASLFALTAADSYGGGVGVLQIFNATTGPTTNPTGGPLLYAQSGALKARGTSGTVTTIAPADPHCNNCGRDFVFEAQNDAYGHLVVCFWCRVDDLNLAEKPYIVRTTN